MSACPALFISAPASGQGKTTITAGLARHHARMGRRVRVFKTGPDFLDPMILARASGAPVQSLDLWMVGERACRALLAEAAENADLILIEGVMGLFDGTPSSADLATTFNVPVVGVISAKAMAQTFGAIAFGLAHFRQGVPFQGVFANRVGSARHAQMLEDALPEGLRWMGHIASANDIELPDRHLGLHQADEIADLDARIDRAADALAGTPLAELPAPVDFGAVSRETQPRLLDGMRIAIARDAAFSFIYPANVALLEALGASVAYFSPLADAPAPHDANALWLPGGYPELHAQTLSGNTVSAATIRAHARAGKTLIAECGGMLYLLDTLTDVSGTRTPMLGLLPGNATMQSRLASLGMQQINGTRGAMHGHTFHYSRMETTMTPLTTSVGAQSAAPGEAVFREGNIVATYMHSYWPSNPAFTAALFHGEAF
ncbi:cobyrinate a,c-diamide synthase [Paraburkholderia saeva]|uniref:Cobyrinate a,c-diamide synthase n=1 Tax=Paraburkholderia saeva TaxID=2777537 RepID=A0A9N8X4V9_9BURK|nr:cobyrinate a,c-diamide synthase [Paraburkholderia saeva]CAG4888740.1 Cobyrinate a,c-diamide synthase [Paraburkholderia saeva]CAG4893771.1 Cobyrinate a,c-diamide synthase [Paraburkholderia saeva]CAG4916110.1 Cobyrinate a,c-diamide synthase [Paraburkholderia saeva]